VAPAEDLAITPPKLIKSVRPNPPAEALRGYISGNVNIDALVDTAGRVKSMKVVSGPATLRNAAMEALKEYRYEPATQKGKPVFAHVNVTVQFWYEP
jgi:protein TonB